MSRLAALVMASCAAAVAPRLLAAVEAQPKPNVIVILADDLGYGDVQCLNPERGKIPTPNLDKLAGQGMIFTEAHSGSSVCTPTRYGLLTGRYAWRTRLQAGVMQDHQPPLIAAGRLTVAGLLKQHGYHTAVIGKWHLGYQYEGITKTPKSSQRPPAWPPVGTRFRDGPISRGFDYFFGFHHAGSMHALAENDRVIEKIEPEEMLPRLTKRAVAYLDERAAAGQPFFLYLPWNSPHTPIVPTKEWRGRSGLNPYADYVMQTDGSVGQVLDALEKNGVAGNTLVIFSSDNGCSPAANVSELERKGHFPSERRRGYKTDIWDGGHRIPLIARWPGHIKAGSRSDQLTCLTDLMATCAEIVGAKLPDHAGEDSVSMLPVLTGQGGSAREAVVHHSVRGVFAIRQGGKKLIFGPGSGGWSKGGSTGRVQLYDLSNDVAERENRQAIDQADVLRLTELMERYIAEGRSTPPSTSWFDFAHHGSGQAGTRQKNDVPVALFKRGEKP